jgi:excisionase family DNA binding protein
MDIKELLKERNVSITLSAQDLYDFAKYVVKEAYKEIEEGNNQKFVSRKEAAELLNISLSTLANWKSQGTLTPILVGKKHLYKRADINKFLVKEGDMDI